MEKAEWPEERKKRKADWSLLPTDVIESIAHGVLLFDVTDYIRIRAACSSWRCATLHPGDASLLLPQPHWLLLNANIGRGFNPFFFHLSTGRSLRLPLPQLHDRELLDYSHGWLVLQHKLSSAILLLNPFTETQLGFPPLSTLLPPRHMLEEMRQMGLKLPDPGGPRHFWVSKPTVCLEERTAMFFVNGFFRIAVARAGDEKWIMSEEHFFCTGTLCHRGRLYAVNSCGTVALIDTGSAPVVRPLVSAQAEHVHKTYLIDSSGVLLLVISYLGGRDYSSIAYFEVFEVKMSGRPELVRMWSLGERALFLGRECTLSISTRNFPHCRANCIYYLDQDGPFMLARLFNLEDGHFESFPYYTTYLAPMDICLPPSFHDHLLWYCNAKLENQPQWLRRWDSA